MNLEISSIAIILARGGSKGLPQKNIIDFCGIPLLAWTIKQCRDGGVDAVYVSSDSVEILEVGEKYGAVSIKRPEDISGDTATSESGWLHALEVIEDKAIKPDWILAPQVTSPLRSAKDIRNALLTAVTEQYDSLFSCSIAEDLFFWEDVSGKLESVNYDWRNRKRRQDIQKQYIENGSFYMFRPDVLRTNNNRFGGRIGVVEMEFWKMFEIDSMEDLQMCSALMKEFLLEKK
jgi:CMP-N,N'-diacetyllegionaminic acid synthase